MTTFDVPTFDMIQRCLPFARSFEEIGALMVLRLEAPWVRTSAPSKRAAAFLMPHVESVVARASKANALSAPPLTGKFAKRAEMRRRAVERLGAR